jgi:hypothetical protein
VESEFCCGCRRSQKSPVVCRSSIPRPERPTLPRVSLLFKKGPTGKSYEGIRARCTAYVDAMMEPRSRICNSGLAFLQDFPELRANRQSYHGNHKPHPFCHGTGLGLVHPHPRFDLELHRSARKERTSIIVYIIGLGIWRHRAYR